MHTTSAFPGAVYLLSKVSIRQPPSNSSDSEQTLLNFDEFEPTHPTGGVGYLFFCFYCYPSSSKRGNNRGLSDCSSGMYAQGPAHGTCYDRSRTLSSELIL